MSSAGAAGAARAAAGVRVRDARRDDVPRIHEMIHELAAFEGFPDGPSVTIEELLRDGFDESPAWYFALIAERYAPTTALEGAEERAGEEEEAEVVGYALCNRAYSSWTQRALYVEDLYVVPAARRGGVGRLLFAHIAQMAVRWGATRIDWHVAESNTGAVQFYEGLGARDLRRSEGRAALRLDQHHILRLAAAAADG